MSAGGLRFFQSATLFSIKTVLGGILLWSGLTHLSNQALFLESIFRYRVFSPAIAVIIAAYLPTFQVTIGSFLLLGLFRRFSLWTTFVLTFLFFLIQLVTLLRGLEIDCGCFGPGEEVITWKSLGFTFLLPICTLALLRHHAFESRSEVSVSKLNLPFGFSPQN